MTLNEKYPIFSSCATILVLKQDNGEKKLSDSIAM